MVDDKISLQDYLIYPVHYTIHNEVYGVFVRNRLDEDFSTSANSEKEAIQMAEAVVLDMAEALIQARRPVPAAAPFQGGDVPLQLSYDVALKIMLRNLMLENRWRISDLSAKTGYSKQRLHSLLSLRKTTSINKLAKLFEAIGHPLQIFA